MKDNQLGNNTRYPDGSFGELIELLYANIGGKIKGFAVFLFIISAVMCFVFAVIMFFGDMGGVVFLLIVVGGTILSWLSSLLMYGFGELIEKVSALAYKSGAYTPSTISELTKLVYDGLVDKDEFSKLSRNIQVVSELDRDKLEELTRFVQTRDLVNKQKELKKPTVPITNETITTHLTLSELTKLVNEGLVSKDEFHSLSQRVQLSMPEETHKLKELEKIVKEKNLETISGDSQ